jgi:hypothetical protein
MLTEDQETELTQARLRIEELEAMLAACESQIRESEEEQENDRMERDLLS